MSKIWPHRNWLDAVVLVVLVGCLAGLVIRGSKSTRSEKQSLQEQRNEALARQLSTLTQSDLIVFPDGRVWYVRAVRGENMDIVGWIGDNARSEEIKSFVLTNGDFTIVRQNDPGWAEKRDRYFKQ